MKTELPDRADYYRPTRARELRRKAARLRRRGWLLLFGDLVLFSNLLTGPLTTQGEAWGYAALAFVGSLIVLVVVLEHLGERCRCLRVEAGFLEGEHTARYGSSKASTLPIP